MNNADIQKRIRFVNATARISLGLVWLYEGLVPKILFLHSHPEQIALVQRSGLFWHTAEITLILLGIAQALGGLVLIIGWAERLAVMTATVTMFVLILLVATGNPAMLTDPFGALAKDVCLVACAITVWVLAPLRD